MMISKLIRWGYARATGLHSLCLRRTSTHTMMIGSLLTKNNNASLIISSPEGVIRSFKRSLQTSSKSRDPSNEQSPPGLFKDVIQDLCDQNKFSEVIEKFKDNLNLSDAFELLVSLNTAKASKSELHDVGVQVYNLMVNNQVIPNRQIYFLLISLFNKLRPQKSIEMFYDMQKFGIPIDDRCFSELSQSVISTQDLKVTRKLIDIMKKKDVVPTIFSLGNILGTLDSCSSPQDSVAILNFVEENNIILNRNIFLKFFSLFAKGRYNQEGDRLVMLLTSPSYNEGLKTDSEIEHSIINLYIRCEKLEKAYHLLQTSKHVHSLVLWNNLMEAFNHQKKFFEAINVYDKLNKLKHKDLTPTPVTYSIVLKACALSGLAIQKVRQIEDTIHKRNVNDPILNPTLMFAFSRNGDNQRSLDIFERMNRTETVTSPITLTEALSACAGLGPSALEKGKKVHQTILERNVPLDIQLHNSIVLMYSKCGDHQRALDIYESLRGKITLNDFSFMFALNACAQLGPKALPNGKQIHEEIIKAGSLSSNQKLWTAVLNMYQMCGENQKCIELFRELDKTDIRIEPQSIVASLIAASSQGKDGLEAVEEIRQIVIRRGMLREFLIEKLNIAYKKCGSDKTIESNYHK